MKEKLETGAGVFTLIVSLSVEHVNLPRDNVSVVDQQL